MFQFLLPPFLITGSLLLALIIAATVFAPAIRCKRILIFPLAVILAGFVFQPIFKQAVLGWQAVAYGERHHAAAGEIRNSLIKRYLPSKATDITLLKEGAGHYALYQISEPDFHAFLAGVWDRYRTDFAAEDGPRYWMTYTEEQIAKALQGDPVGRHSFRESVQALGWPPLEDAVLYEGPRRNSYAGANYYYDRSTGRAYHDAGYW